MKKMKRSPVRVKAIAAHAAKRRRRFVLKRVRHNKKLDEAIRLKKHIVGREIGATPSVVGVEEVESNQ